MNGKQQALFQDNLSFEFGRSDESIPHPHLMGAGSMVAQGLFVPPALRAQQDERGIAPQQRPLSPHDVNPVAQQRMSISHPLDAPIDTNATKQKPTFKARRGGRWGKNGYMEEEEDEVLRAEKNSEWVKRRREQVAKASRAAREKRKREVQGLRKENKRLRDERDHYLDKILQLQRKVEGLREEGSIDIQLENELLKAQLEEHKRFVGGFMKLAMGMPSSEIARRELYKQGTDYAVGHVLSLISQSVKNDWTQAQLPATGPAAALPPPFMNACYQFVDDFGCKREGASHSRQRLNLRIDMALPFVDIETVTNVYWKVWNDERQQARVYGLTHNDNYEFKRLHMENLDNDLDPSGNTTGATNVNNKSVLSATGARDKKSDKDSAAAALSPGALISVAYYREKYPPPIKDRDWVFVATKSMRDMARSTLVRDSPMRLVTTDRASSVGAATLGTGEAKDNYKGNKSKSSGGGMSVADMLQPGGEAAKNIGAVRCNLLARSTTQHLKAPNHENTQRITSLLVEGALFWTEVDERTDTNYTRLAVVLSMPDDIQLRSLNGFRSIITENGGLTDKFGTYLWSFMEAIASSTGSNAMASMAATAEKAKAKID